MVKCFCAEVGPRGCVFDHSDAFHSWDVWDTLAWRVTRYGSRVNWSRVESVALKAIGTRGVHFWAAVGVGVRITRRLIAKIRRVEIIHICIRSRRSDLRSLCRGGSL